MKPTKDTSARGMLDETYRSPVRKLCEPAITAPTPDADRLPDHQPTLYRAAGPFGCWATCVCGWTSESEDVRYRTVMGAHAAFGRHLVDVGGDR